MKALAHITGGGFPDNVPRVLPEGLAAAIDLSRVAVPPVFRWLAARGGIAEAEMLRTFNCGIGMIAVVDEVWKGGSWSADARWQRRRRPSVNLGRIERARRYAGQPRVAISGHLDLAG